MTGQAVIEHGGSGRPCTTAASALVGRERELAELTRVLAASPAVALIEGEAGIGKSRLLRESLTSPPGRTHTALVTCCPPFRQPQTLGPVTDALRQATGDVACLPLTDLAGALRPLFPEWAAALPPAPERAEDATAARHRLFRALSELIGCLGVSLVIAEDVHWADEATLEFLLYLASREPRRLSLVVTYRPEDLPPGSLLPRVSRLTAGTGLRLTLGPLDVTHTQALMSSMLAGEPVSDEFAAFVHQRAEGVPLAIEESVRLMADRADLARRDGGWVRRRLADIAVPPTVRDAVLERAGRLSADAQSMLRAAAVIAEQADEALLADVSALPPSQAGAGLAEALRAGLLDENDRGLLSFRHALAAQAVDEAVPRRERRLLHLRAGRTLEGASPPPLTRLARHFREAGEMARWCRYGEQAADRALASGDEAAAAMLLHELVTRAGLPAGVVARLMSRFPFSSLREQARLQELIDALKILLGSRPLEPREEADIRVQLGQALTHMQEWAAGRAELERAIPQLQHDPVARARAMMLLAWPRGTSCPAAEHARWLAQAAELDVPGGPAERLRFAVDRATALLHLGEEGGWAEAAKIPLDQPATAVRREIIRGHLNIGDQALRWGRYGEAAQRLEKALDLTRSHQYWLLRDYVQATVVHLDWLTGSWEGLVQRAASLADNADIVLMARLEAALVVGLLDAAVGARRQADERLRLVLAETERRAEMEYMMEAAAALARLGLSDGRVGDALQVTEEPISLVAAKRTWVWATDIAPARVEALTAAGRIDEASHLTGAFARGLRGRDAPGPKAAVALCRAMLAEARGQQARAAALFGRAVAAWQVLPRPYDALLAQERQSGCLQAAGDRAAGAALLTTSFQGLSQLGASGDAARVARRLREQDGATCRKSHGGRRGYGNQLSPRELDVARLLVEGGTNRDIGGQLFLSPKTVARHLDSAMRKLGVASRTALAVRLVEGGIISAEPVVPAGRAAVVRPPG